MKISLRKLNEYDLEAFSRWMRDEELLSTFFAGIEVPLKEEVLKSFASMLKSKKDFYYIVEDKNIPIGLLSLLKEKRANEYKIQLLIGEKDYWYKGCDVEALKCLAEEIRNKDIDVFLEVKSENEKAIAIFSSFGFTAQKIKKYPKDPLFPKVLRMDFNKRDIDFLTS